MKNERSKITLYLTTSTKECNINAATKIAWSSILILKEQIYINVELKKPLSVAAILFGLTFPSQKATNTLFLD